MRRYPSDKAAVDVEQNTAYPGLGNFSRAERLSSGDDLTFLGI